MIPSVVSAAICVITCGRFIGGLAFARGFIGSFFAGFTLVMLFIGIVWFIALQ